MCGKRSLNCEIFALFFFVSIENGRTSLDIFVDEDRMKTKLSERKENYETEVFAKFERERRRIKDVRAKCVVAKP